MRTILVIMATLVADTLIGHLWLLCTSEPIISGYTGFALAVFLTTWLVGMVAWLARGDK